MGLGFTAAVRRGAAGAGAGAGHLLDRLHRLRRPVRASLHRAGELAPDVGRSDVLEGLEQQRLDRGHWCPLAHGAGLGTRAVAGAQPARRSNRAGGRLPAVGRAGCGLRPVVAVDADATGRHS